MFGNNFTDIPSISSFEDAKRHYESIKPIRGSDNLRPACKTPNGRRKKHIQIVERNEGNSYAIRLFETDVVTFHNNNTLELNNGGWATSSTHGVITDLLWRVGVEAKTRNGETWLSLKGGDFRIADGVDAILEPDEDDVLTLRNPDPVMVHKLDRKPWNQVRKQHSAFLSYISSMSKLLEPTDHSNRWDELNKQRRTLELLLDARIDTREALLEEDPNSTWLSALEMFTVGATKHEWNFSVNGASSWKTSLVIPAFRKQAYDLLKCLYSGSLFVEEEAPLGKYVKDSNARYMK